MTKKHFEAIAIAFQNAKNRTRKHAEHSNIRQLCYDIIEICEQVNPNFDRDKFLKVVNKSENEVIEEIIEKHTGQVPKRMQEMLTIPSE